MAIEVKLNEVINRKDNNFNLIRMLAATLVVFSHSFSLSTGSTGAEPLTNSLGISLGYIAVDIFFISSGLLVCKSLFTSRELRVFIISRCLRIYPALIFSVLLCCLLGMLISDLSLMEYFSNSKLKQFVLYNSTIVLTDYQELPGVFHNAPLGQSVNGSLWTLPWELKMYLILIGLGFLSYIFKKLNVFMHMLPVVIILIALTSLSLFLNNYISDAEWHWFYTAFYRFTAMFFLGGAIYVLRNYLTLKLKYMLFATALLIFTNSINKDAFFISYVVLVPYIVLCIAYIPKGKILNYNKLGDYSYGMYIYAWPIQQTLATHIIGITPLSMFCITFIITLLLSYLSWNYIEKPSLKMKCHFI